MADSSPPESRPTPKRRPTNTFKDGARPTKEGNAAASPERKPATAPKPARKPPAPSPRTAPPAEEGSESPPPPVFPRQASGEQSPPKPQLVAKPTKAPAPAPTELPDVPALPPRTDAAPVSPATSSPRRPPPNPTADARTAEDTSAPPRPEKTATLPRKRAPAPDPEAAAAAAADPAPALPSRSAPAKAEAPPAAEPAPPLPTRTTAAVDVPPPLVARSMKKKVPGAVTDSSSSDTPLSTSPPKFGSRKSGRSVNKSKPDRAAPPPPTGAKLPDVAEASTPTADAPAEEADKAEEKPTPTPTPTAGSTGPSSSSGSPAKSAADAAGDVSSDDDEDYEPLDPPSPKASPAVPRKDDSKHGKVLIMNGKTPDIPLPYAESHPQGGDDNRKVIDELLGSDTSRPADTLGQAPRPRRQIKKKNSLLNFFKSGKAKKDDQRMMGKQLILDDISPTQPKIGTAQANKVIRARDSTCLDLSNAETVDIVMLDGPVGQWVARNSIGDVGFVNCADVTMDPEALKAMMSSVPKPKKMETTAEGLRLDMRGTTLGVQDQGSDPTAALPATPGDDGRPTHNYEDVVLTPQSGDAAAAAAVVQPDYAPMAFVHKKETEDTTPAVSGAGSPGQADPESEENREETYEVLSGVNNPAVEPSPPIPSRKKDDDAIHVESIYENEDEGPESDDGYEMVGAGQEPDGAEETYEVMKDVNIPPPEAADVGDYEVMGPGEDTYDAPREVARVELNRAEASYDTLDAVHTEQVYDTIDD